MVFDFFKISGGYFYLVATFERHKSQLMHLVSLSSHMSFTNYVFLRTALIAFLDLLRQFSFQLKFCCKRSPISRWGSSDSKSFSSIFDLMLPFMLSTWDFSILIFILLASSHFWIVPVALFVSFCLQAIALKWSEKRSFQLLASFRASHWWTGETEVAQELTLGVHRLWIFGEKIFGSLLDRLFSVREIRLH